MIIEFVPKMIMNPNYIGKSLVAKFSRWIMN